MAEQNNRPGIFPAEGRVDVAADLEEERRNAYSSHHRGPPFQRPELQKPGQGQFPEASVLPPAEGRVDVAADLEEERRNAYSAHRAGPVPRL